MNEALNERNKNITTVKLKRVDLQHHNIVSFAGHSVKLRMLLEILCSKANPCSFVFLRVFLSK